MSLAIVLLDNEVSFNTCENRQLSDEIISLTLSKRETVEKADYIFVEDGEDLKDVLENAKCGSLSDPHKSATIIVKTSVGEKKPLTLKGPGIDGSKTVTASPLVSRCLQIRDNIFFEYPEGIDFIFIDENYDMFAVPRLLRKEVVA